MMCGKPLGKWLQEPVFQYPRKRQPSNKKLKPNKIFIHTQMECYSVQHTLKYMTIRNKSRIRRMIN